MLLISLVHVKNYLFNQGFHVIAYQNVYFFLQKTAFALSNFDASFA